MTPLADVELPRLAERVEIPAYDRRAVKTGIVHLGFGNFHRAHEAMFVDRILSAGGDGWGICGVGVLEHDRRMADVMRLQNGLYTLVTTDADGSSRARVIGSVVDYLFAPDDPDAVITRMADPAVRIVSLTITEGGYVLPEAGLPVTGARAPITAFRLIVEALERRRDAGIAPFTVMSCDNLQGNGDIARATVIAAAERTDPELARWIDREVAFPNSMVDRITPATTADGIRLVRDRYGVDDEWPVLAEDWVQWVLEDRFANGRPPFEDVGVQLVENVEPYELMKLRLVNATHQAIGYLGLLAGLRYVHEVCTDPEFASFLTGYMGEEATPTLQPVPGIDLEAYRARTIERFTNTAIADTLSRLVADSYERIHKFLVPVIRDELKLGPPARRSALILAAWCEFNQGGGRDGRNLPIDDRRAAQLADAAEADLSSPGEFLRRVELEDLAAHRGFLAEFRSARDRLRTDGVQAAMRAAGGG